MTGLEVSRDLAGGGVEKGEGGGSVVGGEIVIWRRGGQRASAVRVVGVLDCHLEVRDLVKGSNLREEIGDLLHLTRELPQALGEMEQTLQEGVSFAQQPSSV